MLATKRYEYLAIEKIEIHHQLTNHRQLDRAKVAHLEKDIVANGLLEPLVVWERTSNEYYLVGGFHRIEAIYGIRKVNPGYFDRVDVRVVAGDPDEIKALNLKLNSDRVDTRITDYFQTVLFLNNVNWSRERIAEFFDKSTSWIDDILRYAPLVTEPMREKLANGELSWSKAREILQKTLKAPPGMEREIIAGELADSSKPAPKPLPFRATIRRITETMAKEPTRTFKLNSADLYALVMAIRGKNVEQEQLERVRKALPILWDD